MITAMGEFEVGEVVCLASEGGPNMTVTGEGTVTGMHDAPGVMCTWFNDQGEVQTGTFPADALRHFRESGDMGGLDLK